VLALLFDCSIVQQRAVIQFLQSEGVNPPSHRRILAQYGEDCTIQRKVYQWWKVSTVAEQVSLLTAQLS